jgi:hypothetical protein
MTSTLKARFTAKQADLLYVGLRPLILNHFKLIHTGRSPGAHPDLLTVKFLRRRGLYNEEFMQAIVGLWKGLQFGRRRPLRTSFDYVTVSAYMLAVRTALREDRKQPWWEGFYWLDQSRRTGRSRGSGRA